MTLRNCILLLCLSYLEHFSLDILMFLLLSRRLLQLDFINWRKRLITHSLINAVNKLLILFNLLHHLSYPTLIEENLTLITRLSDKSSQFVNLFLSFLNITSKDINLILTMYINILHNLFPSFLLHLLPIVHYRFSSLLETLLSLFNPCLTHYSLLFVYCSLIKIEQIG